MSAVGLTIEASPEDRQEPWHVGLATVDPVDHFEVAARLEASGFGDIAASREGSADVFTYAQRQSPTSATNAAQRFGPEARKGREWSAAWIRALLLVTGAVTLSVGTSAVLPIGGSAMLVAGLCGWISGQFCGGPVWRRFGLGDDRGAVEVGVWCVRLVASILAVGLIGFLRGPSGGPERLSWMAIVSAWTLYAVLISVVGVVGTLSRVATVAAVTAAAVAFLVLTGRGQFAILCPVLLLVVVVVEAVHATRATGSVRPRRPDVGDLIAARDGTVQAVGLAVSLLGLLFLVPPATRGGVTIAVMSASALTDPLLVAIGRLYRYLTRRVTSWRRARQSIVVATSLAMLVFAFGSAMLAQWIASATAHGLTTFDLRDAAVVTAAASVLNTGGAIVYRAGRGRTAMLLALGAALAIVSLETITHIEGIVTIAMVAVLSIILAAQAAVHPRSW